MKQPWSTPQLVELARSDPQEAVLIACKAAASGTTPHNIAAGCQNPGSGSPCGPAVPGAGLNAFTRCLTCDALASS